MEISHHKQPSLIANILSMSPFDLPCTLLTVTVNKQSPHVLVRQVTSMAKDLVVFLCWTCIFECLGPFIPPGNTTAVWHNQCQYSSMAVLLVGNDIDVVIWCMAHGGFVL